jgi:hypothetical protein
MPETLVWGHETRVALQPSELELQAGKSVPEL